MKKHLTLPNILSLAAVFLAVVTGLLVKFHQLGVGTEPVFWLLLAALVCTFLDGEVAKRIGGYSRLGHIVQPSVVLLVTSGALMTRSSEFTWVSVLVMLPILWATVNAVLSQRTAPRYGFPQSRRWFFLCRWARVITIVGLNGLTVWVLVPLASKIFGLSVVSLTATSLALGIAVIYYKRDTRWHIHT